jgi:hypothetical protein
MVRAGADPGVRYATEESPVSSHAPLASIRPSPFPRLDEFLATIAGPAATLKSSTTPAPHPLDSRITAIRLRVRALANPLINRLDAIYENPPRRKPVLDRARVSCLSRHSSLTPVIIEASWLAAQ